MALNLNAVIYVDTQQAHHVGAATVMLAGLKHHGINARIVNSSYPVPCDLAIFWGHHRRQIIRHQRDRGCRYLVMERAYIADRFRWISLGFDGLNGYAKFPVINDGGVRWNKHFGGLLKPWKYGGDYALLIGQVPGDAAIANVNIDEWYDQIAKGLRLQGKRVIFRPHPVAIERRMVRAPHEVEFDMGTLQESLADASMVVTYSSNAGVDAVLAGVPTVACDRGSMAWDVAAHDLSERLVRPSREAWAHAMAYKQWLPEEIANGTAWEHLKTCL